MFVEECNACGAIHEAKPLTMNRCNSCGCPTSTRKATISEEKQIAYHGLNDGLLGRAFKRMENSYDKRFSELEERLLSSVKKIEKDAQEFMGTRPDTPMSDKE